MEDYLAYDLDGDRSSVSLDAVRDDSADLLDADAAAVRVAGLAAGTVFLRAPAGMLGDPGGLYPAESVAEHLRTLPGLVARDVPGTNHYTIVMGETGARAVADALDEVLNGSSGWTRDPPTQARRPAPRRRGLERLHLRDLHQEPRRGARRW